MSTDIETHRETLKPICMLLPYTPTDLYSPHQGANSTLKEVVNAAANDL